MTFPLINRQKIGIIYNALVPQSLADAKDYIARRGLNSSLLLGVNFYPPSSDPAQTNGGLYLAWPWIFFNKNGYSPDIVTAPYNTMSLISGVAQWTNDNLLEGIILSTYTAESVTSPPGGNFMSLSRLLGMANQAVAYGLSPTGSVWNRVSDTLASTYLPQYNQQTWYSSVVNQSNPPSPTNLYSYGYNSAANPLALYTPGGWQQFRTIVNPNWKTLYFSTGYRQIPAGRLGMPNFFVPGATQTKAPIQEVTTIYGVPVYQNAVTSALAAEQVNQSASLHLYSTQLCYQQIGSNPPTYFVSPTNNATVGPFLQTRGFTNVKNVAQGGDIDPTAFYNGTVTVPNVFGYAMASATRPGTPFGLYYPSTPVAKGAWLVDWSSADVFVSQPFMVQNGTATIANTGEPLAPYCGASPNEIAFMLTTTRCSMMEASFLSVQADYLTGHNMGPGIYGDPLYSPYQSTPSFTNFQLPTSNKLGLPDGSWLTVP